MMMPNKAQGFQSLGFASLVFGLIATWGASAHADVAPWLGPGWKVRRVVDAKVEPSSYPGAEVAVCTFYSGGMMKADGSDLRVAAEGRRLVPHRVLQIGPGDLVRIAFAATPGAERYYIYYGNPEAGPPTETWEPERGVLLEARPWPGGPMDRLGAVQTIWEKSKPAGAAFVSHINFGFNPFGESEAPMMYHYTGWVVVPEAGTYDVATSSDEASWLLIDGKEAVSWPGEHGPLWDARHAAKCTLTQGVHRLDYWHVNGGGSMMAVAAWRVPETDRFVPIPPNAFLPVTHATLVETDVQNERIVADFFAEHAGESWWPDHYAVRIQFKNLSKGISLRQGGRFDWNFGDGQTSQAAEPVHVYLAPGDYTVTLKASRSALAHTFRTKVRVERNWWKQAERAIDPVKGYGEAVARYDFQTLDPANLFLAVQLFDYQKMSDALIAAARAFAVEREGASEADRYAVSLLLGKYLRESGGAREAVGIYRRMEERTKTPAQKARLALETAETLLGNLYEYDQAEGQCQRVLKTYAAVAGDEVLRRAHIGMGDVWRHRGKTEEARRAYEAAVDIQIKVYTPAQVAVRIGTLARYVEEYTRERQWEWAFQFLDEWAWEFPLGKLEGHWSLLRVRALVAKGDREEALREALDLLAANPTSPYAVRLLMEAAECQVALGSRDQARRLLETAVEDYPEDPSREEALQRLRTIGE